MIKKGIDFYKKFIYNNQRDELSLLFVLMLMAFPAVYSNYFECGIYRKKIIELHHVSK